MDTADDLFEGVLNLEDQYHQEGFEAGVADGSRAGRIEGRIFGVEKGFEKMLEMGRLNGRAAVWQAGLCIDDHTESSNTQSSKLPSNKSERLKKHISRLQDLSDPETISTDNTEDAVSEFDDRLKDAKAKATLISKFVSEDDTLSASEAGQLSSSSLRGLGIKGNESKKQLKEMEDFTGSSRNLPGGS